MLQKIIDVLKNNRTPMGILPENRFKKVAQKILNLRYQIASELFEEYQKEELGYIITTAKFTIWLDRKTND